MPLSTRDLDVLQTALLELHEERDLTTFSTTAPDIVRAAIPCDHFTWLESQFAGITDPMRGAVIWDSPPLITPAIHKRMLALVTDHPFTIHARKTGDWGPLRLSDFWTDTQTRSSALWKDVLRHTRGGRLLSSAAFRGERVGTLNLSRPLAKADFSERDRHMLRQLTPHFIQAMHAAERVTARREGVARTQPELGLTARESEVGVWLARGRTNPEIARILAMQPRTVEKHVERILVKLGVENRTAAAMIIGGLQLLETEEAVARAPAPAVAPSRTRRTGRKKR